MSLRPQHLVGPFRPNFLVLSLAYEIKIIDLDSATYNQNSWIVLASGVVCLGTKVIAKKSNGLSESSANGDNPLRHRFERLYLEDWALLLIFVRCRVKGE
jgi:hypothetical protein